MVFPNNLQFPLRLSPSGPPVPLAQLVALLQPFLGPGQVARAWCSQTPAYPAESPGVDLPAGLLTTVDSIIIPCTVDQLGRAYLVWQALCVVPPRAAQDPETQPDEVLVETGVKPAGAPFYSSITQGHIPIMLASVIHGEGDLFPWVAYGAHYSIIKPPFVAGNNRIRLGGECVTLPGFVPADFSRHLIVELTGDLADFVPVAPDSEAPAI